MNGIERIKLIGKLVQLNKTVPGASPVERIKGIGQIITIVKQLGGTVNAGGAKEEPYAEESGLENNFPAIKSNKDFVKFFDANDCEVLYSDEPEIKHLESYLKSSGQTHFECENWVSEEGFGDGGSGIISTTRKVKEKQVWDFNGKNWGYYLESDEAYRRQGEAREAVAAFAEGVRNGTLKVTAAMPEKLDKDKVTSVEDFCRRIEKNPSAIQAPENQTRRLLFAYLEEKYPRGFKGALSLKGVDGKDHAYAAVWSRTNGEWYRDVQAHPEMAGALSQLDQNGSLVLFDFSRFASNGSLNSLPKYTSEDGEASEAVSEAWAKDRETLQSIIDGTHPDMKLPVLYDALAGINERQKDNPEYPEMLERALDEWQAVVMDMTAKIVA